ncbi:MAG: CHAP domain-containing protein [Gaiellaceae bacterium]
MSWAIRPFLFALLVAIGVGASPALGVASAPVVVYGYPYASRCPVAGYDDVIDRWGMYMCNCTSYVTWALHANGQRTDWFIPGAMNAWNWPHVARLAHLPVGTRPRVRAVAVWPKLSPPFGHIAYVTGVGRDGGIDVSEYNSPGTWVFDPFVFDVRRDIRPAGAVFIYVPARRTVRP